VLLIPRRHITTFFELNRKERNDFFELLLEVREILQSQFHPDGFNIGVNMGRAAGQTIAHLHVHVIPRYSGDVEHPEGGVRNVIPALGPYTSRADN
jgi:diadenosine tetraphosphate (Ap4A) HIT family hydrolase